MGTENESDSEHGRGTDTGRIDLQLNEENAGVLETELPAFLDEKQIMAVIANKADNLHYKKQQIELFFSVHSNGQERADYLKSAYPDRQTEITADGVQLGFQPPGKWHAHVGRFLPFQNERICFFLGHCGPVDCPVD